MARGRKPRTWVKIDCEGILRGSINYLLNLEGQAIWIKMIALSEVCGGRPGYIEDNNEKGLPREYIAHELHCSVDLLDGVVKKMQSDGAIDLDGNGSIRLVNFEHYQFREYDRQRPYRQAKKEREKETHGEFGNVFLAPTEVSNLVEKFGEIGANKRIESLSLYIQSKGDKYKSHYATILNWDRMDNSRSRESETHKGDPKQTSASLKRSIGKPLAG